MPLAVEAGIAGQSSYDYRQLYSIDKAVTFPQM